MDVNLTGNTAAKACVTQKFTEDYTRKAYGHVNSLILFLASNFVGMPRNTREEPKKAKEWMWT